MASSYIGFFNGDPKLTEVPNYTYQVSKSKKGTFKKPAGAGKAAPKKPAARESAIETGEEEEIPDKLPEKTPPACRWERR